MNYYNENDPFCVQWLKNLIANGLIPDGHVDPRSIEDVRPGDLDGYDQCHFFAGIAGWALALQLAGVPSTEPLWTASCPCQPFSEAGKGLGEKDPRHLWPVLRRLIAQRKPAIVFGEQVASKAGRGWLAGVRTDLEDLGYAVGAADLCAAGVGSPHIRQRLWWVADSNGRQPWNGDVQPGGEHGQQSQDGRALWVADAECGTSERHGLSVGGEASGLQGEARQREWIRADTRDGGKFGRMGDAIVEGSQRLRGHVDDGDKSGRLDTNQDGSVAATSHWRDFELVYCRDKLTRRVEPGTFPLAHGVPGRVGRLRAYGNAIVPQVAAEFIAAFYETIPPSELDPCR